MLANITKIPPSQTIYYLSWLLCFTLPLPIFNGKVGFLSLLLLIFWLAEGNLKNKFTTIINNKFYITLMLLIILSLLSLFWSKYASIGLSRLSPYKYFPVIIPILLTSISRENAKNLIFAFVLGMTLHAFLTLFQFTDIVLSEKISIYKPYAVYSPFLTFTTLYYLNKSINSTNNKKSLIFYFSFFLILTAILFINPGRAGQLSYIVSVLILIFMLHKKWLNTLLILAITIALISSVIFFSKSTKSRFISASNNIQQILKSNYVGSWGARWGLLVTHIETFKNNPLVGVGVGDYQDEFQRNIEKGTNQSFYAVAFFDTPHNQYVTFLTMLGLLGFGLYILLHIYIFKLNFHEKEFKNLSWIFICILIVHSMSDEILFMKQFNNFFAVIATLFLTLSIKENENINHS